LTVAGPYTHMLKTVNGCDSLISLTLTVNPTYNTPISATICDNESYPFFGEDLTVAGPYTHMLKTVNGCDSLISLTLTVNPTYNTPISATICEGKKYNFFETMLDTEGEYRHTLKTVHNCDSVIVLTLNIDEIAKTDIFEEICQGDSYDFNGKLLTTEGTYKDTINEAGECDIEVTLHLTVKRCPKDLLLKLFLEGPFDPLPVPHMNEYIQAIVLPFINPYGVPGSCQQIRSKIGPIGEVEDWVLVEIWGNFSGSFPMITYDLLEQRALLLRPDGTVIDTTGQVPKFLLNTNNPVRVVVKHRDHLAVISNNLFAPDEDIEWDFTVGTNKAIAAPFTLISPMIAISGTTCLWAGDLNGNNIIDAVDATDFHIKLREGVSGIYEDSDFNMDAYVDAFDKEFISVNARINLYSSVRYFKKR